MELEASGAHLFGFSFALVFVAVVLLSFARLLIMPLRQLLAWAGNMMARLIFLRRCSPMKAFTFTLAFCFVSGVVLVYYVTDSNLVRKKSSPPQPMMTCRPEGLRVRERPQSLKSHDSADKQRLGHRALVLVESPYTKSVHKITESLEAVRIDFKVDSMARNLPTLTHGDKGKFAVIIFETLDIYVRMDKWNKQLLNKYCQDYNVGMIVFTPWLDNEEESGDVPGFPLTLQHNVAIQNYWLDPTSDIWRVARPGEVWNGPFPPESDWTVFHSNHSTYRAMAFARVATPVVLTGNQVQYVHPRNFVPLVHDQGLFDGIQRVFFGTSLEFWIHNVVFYDCLSYLSHGKLSIPLERYIQIDIDDIFVARPSIRMKVEDVEALVATQDRIAMDVEGFKYILGFSGRYFLSGNDEEDAGDRLLIEYKDKFWWFGHMSRHEQAHRFDEAYLEKSMRANLQFAKEHKIPVETQYAVAPHHSGVYPVHEPLYSAWRKVWDIKVTSTEEYPHLYPSYRRRGFIYKGIMVLPRQTCGLFTHTIFVSDFNKGLEGLMANIQGGELFNTILVNPISIFMTHLSNYGNDRLGLYTFESVVKFIKCWTNLKLMSLPPLQLGIKYFEMFPEEKDPIWQNPCDNKRHIQIWSPNKTCERLPKFVIIGPQKTGTTALYKFLSMHPAVVSNKNSPRTFEEVQFFNGNNYLKGLDWYMEFFPQVPNNTILFEKSATYFDNELVPRRIHALLPKAKIICILISPARRAYSWYQHMRAHSDPVAMNYSFYDVITASELSERRLRELRNRCLHPGHYAQHLVHWLDYFTPRQIYIIDGDLLRNEPAEVMRNLQRFLHAEPYFDYHSHLRYDPRKGFYCQVINGTNDCLGKGKGRVYNPMSEKEATFLHNYYRRHNMALAKLLNRINVVIPDWLENDIQDHE